MGKPDGLDLISSWKTLEQRDLIILAFIFPSVCSKNRKMSWWKDGEIRSKLLDPLYKETVSG